MKKRVAYGFPKPTLSPAMAARRALLRRIHKRALYDLRAIVPTLQRRTSTPDEITIVREATKLIGQLEATVLARLAHGSLKSASSIDEIRQRFLGQYGCLPLQDPSSSPLDYQPKK